MRGRAWKFGDNIDTDAIIPARYLNTTDPQELAGHCMEDADPDFVKKLRPNDVIVGGANFGCGSSREHAPISIKAAGVSCVIARTFARIFFRNSINIGLPILPCPEAADDIQTGDELDIDLATGRIVNVTRDRTYTTEPFPEQMREIIAAGGLMKFVKESLG